MARTPMPPAKSAEAPFNAALAAEDAAAATALAKLEDEAQGRARVLAAQMGYEGSLAPDVIEDLVKLGMRRTAEAAYATGMALLILKEVSPHGTFVARVEAIGMGKRLAQTLMSAASKLGKSANPALLIGAAGTQAKLLELIVLDDEQLDLLTEGGQVKGITLDRIDTMSASELRAALREKDAELQVSREARQRLDEQLDEAKKRARLVQRQAPDARLKALHSELGVAAHVAFAAVTAGLGAAFTALAEYHTEHGGDSRAAMVAAAAQVQSALLALREEHALPEMAHVDGLDFVRAMQSGEA